MATAAASCPHTMTLASLPIHHHRLRLPPSPLLLPQHRTKSMATGFQVCAVHSRRENRKALHERIRKKVEGTSERPRLSVFRSNKHMYAQVIDDSSMHTLAAVSTMQKSVSEEFNISSGATIEVATKMGEIIAKKCLEKGINKVAFDRGGYVYHGRIKALADAAREHGLNF
ncbi:hypothetical protein Droror1_Dr00001109 [Drosera rotundifolia]